MKRITLFLFACFLFFPCAVRAAATPWQRDNDISVRLITGIDAIGQENTLPLALEVEMAPGWHVYWRSPGPLGMPPKFDWKATLGEGGNLAEATLQFPAPERFGEPGFESFGYRERVVFPIDAPIKTVGEPVVIDASLDMLACSTICVPKHFELALTIPAGEAAAAPETALIDAARASVPAPASGNGLNIAKTEAAHDSLTVTLMSPEPLSTPDAFVENDKDIMFAKPEVALAEDKLSATLTLKPADALPEGTDLTQLPVTLTVVDGAKAIEQRIDPGAPALTPAPEPVAQPAPAPLPMAAPVAVDPAPATTTTQLWIFALLALMGGFVLNLTPCVLPVLSLKILSVAQHGGGECRYVRRSFLTTAAGIMASFLVLAGVTMALKATGQAVGWGIQFQQPAFLVFLVCVLTLFAANLWDVFEVALPRFVADRIDPGAHPKLAGDFLTGAFATLLATPCTAPFLSAAVAFALAGGRVDILVVFTALGAGMAIPYFAVALWPTLATMLPRPGAWMVVLRRVMGVALALTALWLVYVLSAQIAALAAVGVATCMVLMALVLTLRHHLPSPALVRVILGALALTAFLIAVKAPVASAASSHQADIAWQRFDEKALARYVAEGKTVFVDVTADWCVNCKANKQFTLARKEVKHCLFGNNDIIAMRADWTQPNPEIAAFLQRHGRAGIPFNAVFGPAQPQGIVLPELLTPDTVIRSLAEAHVNPYSC